jgi:hypothetical protein
VAFFIALAILLLVGVPVVEVLRTKNDRRTLQDQGVDIGLPWSGRCVTSRQVDLQSSPDASLQVAVSAIVAIKGSGVVVDRNAWSANGWTGTHIGAYGSQVPIFLTQVAGWPAGSMLAS